MDGMGHASLADPRLSYPSGDAKKSGTFSSYPTHGMA